MNSKEKFNNNCSCYHCYWRIAFQFLNHTGPFKDDSQHSSSNSTQIELKGKEKSTLIGL